MTNSDVILFTSPKAGSGAAREQIPRLKDLLSSQGVEHQELSCPETLGEISARRRETDVPQPVVVTAGGDGTISLAAAKTARDTPLLPMPMGTENLLARHFGQSNDAEAVLQTLRSGRRIPLDAGEANGRLFLIMATVGFDAEVVRELDTRRKGHIRRLSYLAPILRTLANYRFPNLRVAFMPTTDNGETTQTEDAVDVGWAMVFNLPCYAAGLNICPDAIGDDGNLDLVTFDGRGIFSGLRYLAGVSFKSHRRFGDVNDLKVSNLRIESELPVAYELDGDYAGTLPLDIKTLPGRVTLMVPPA